MFAAGLGTVASLSAQEDPLFQDVAQTVRFELTYLGLGLRMDGYNLQTGFDLILDAGSVRAFLRVVTTTGQTVLSEPVFRVDAERQSVALPVPEVVTGPTNVAELTLVMDWTLSGADVQELRVEPLELVFAA